MDLKYVYEENYLQIAKVLLIIITTFSFIIGVITAIDQKNFLIFFQNFVIIFFFLSMFFTFFFVFPNTVVLLPKFIILKRKHNKIKKNGIKKTGKIIKLVYMNPYEVIGSNKHIRNLKRAQSIFQSYLLINIDGKKVKIDNISGNEFFIKTSAEGLKEEVLVDVYCLNNEKYFVDLKALREKNKN